jgi:hypothetical protein
MAGEIQIGGTTFATESGGTVTISNVDSATNRQNLGLEIGVDVQAFDSDTTKNDVANTFTANQIISVTDNTNAALRVTQLGTGNALVVEDETNPDSTPFVVDAGGNVGIGTTSLTNKLTINSSAFGQVVDLQKSGVTYGSLIIAGGYPGIAVGTTAGFAINPNSVALVPATSSGESDNTHDLGRAGARWNECYLSNGTINGSDRNEKTEITTSELGLDFINKINPVSYKWNGRYRTHYGMVSQEIETLLSDVGKTSMDFAGFIKSPVTDEDGNETGEYRYGLRYTEFISPMIKAIQEQQTLIESQQSQIDALTARIEALEDN